MINAVILSLLAGLATGLGSLIVIILKKIDEKTMGFSLGLSSGIMIIIGIKDLFGKSLEMSNYYFAIISFIAGALFILVLDILLPHEFFFKEHGVKSKKNFDLLKIGMILAIGITIHNIPEGMSVGAGYAVMPLFGIMLAVAIAIHNIPEGVAVSVPLCASGCSKIKVFLISLVSGLSESLGAVIATVLLSFVKDVLPISLGFAGGVMTYIAMDELIPTAEKYGHQHAISIGLMIGLIIALMLRYLV